MTDDDLTPGPLTAHLEHMASVATLLYSQANDPALRPMLEAHQHSARAIAAYTRSSSRDSPVTRRPNNHYPDLTDDQVERLVLAIAPIPGMDDVWLELNTALRARKSR